MADNFRGLKAYEVLVQTPNGPRPYSVWAMDPDEASETAIALYDRQRGGYKDEGVINRVINRAVGNLPVQDAALAASRTEQENNAYRHMKWAESLHRENPGMMADVILGAHEATGLLGKAFLNFPNLGNEEMKQQALDTLVDIRNNMLGKAIAGKKDLTDREVEGLIFGKATGVHPDEREVVEIDEEGRPYMPPDSGIDPISGMYRRPDYVKISGQQEGGAPEPAQPEPSRIAQALGYDTEDAAVSAAMQLAMPLSGKYEYGGIVYQGTDGKYYHSEPATSKQTHDIKIEATKPKGSKLVALYHTHPGGHESDVFSEHDMTVANNMKVPYYMGDVAGKRVKRYRPGTKGRKARQGEDVGS